MKPFNLEKALAGEPVRLSNGRKAYIKYVLGDEYSTNYPLRGFVEWKRFRDRSISIGEHSWTLKGEFAKCKENELDIVGMWEEPKPKPKRFINGIEVPEPVTEETWINGAKYYYVTLVTPNLINISSFYIDNAIDYHLIKNNLVFETQEGAEAMAKALLNYKVEVKNE